MCGTCPTWPRRCWAAVAWVEQEHANIMLALLAAAPGATPLVVYDGKVPLNPSPQYVLVYFSTTAAPSTSLSSRSDRAVTRAFCHCVGPDATGARAVAGRVHDALVDVVPVVAGRVCFPIRDDNSGAPPDRDETTGPLVMDQVSVFRLESVAA